MITVRRATREDIASFSDMANKPTVKAWVGEVDGRLVGLGGIALIQGRWFGFCDLREEARKHKMAIARTALLVLKEAKDMGVRFIYAQADPREAGAVRWLTRLGFAVDHRTPALYRWRA